MFRPLPVVVLPRDRQQPAPKCIHSCAQGPTLKTFSAVCALTQVASLSFHNVPTLGAPDLGALTALTALTRLRMTSDLHHAAALDHYRAHAARPAQPLAPPHGVVGAPAWAALCQLTSLRHLEVPVAGLLDARALSALWALTCLVLQGQAVVLDGEQTYYSSSAAPAAGAGAGRQPARAGQGAEPPLVETPGTHCSLQRLLPNLEVCAPVREGWGGRDLDVCHACTGRCRRARCLVARPVARRSCRWRCPAASTRATPAAALASTPGRPPPP